tara:strand:+ start:1034 stop:1651 length:618 start_codon:yes stop_codon:yes gene_type:complete
MSETQEATASTKAKRPPPEVTTVTLEDGRSVTFTGKTKMNKEVLADGSVRFDFANGNTRTFDVANSNLLLELASHGAKQKIGDETAGVADVDDMVIAVDAMLERLAKGDWSKAREAGDGFSGASVVIRAVMEATGKVQADVKAFLDGKLKVAEERGEKLSRKDLYDSFRKPGTKTGDIIARLENEKKAKAAKFDGDDLAAELAAI